MIVEEFICKVIDHYNERLNLAIKWRTGNSWFIEIIHRLIVVDITNPNYYINLGHPMNLKTRWINCRSRNLNLYLYEFLREVDELKTVRDIDFEIWKKEYLKFHEDVMNDKGHNCCEENLGE